METLVADSQVGGIQIRNDTALPPIRKKHM